MNWNDPPDMTDVHRTLKRVADLEAQAEYLKLEIKEVELHAKKEKPRDVAHRELASLDLQKELAKLNGELASVKADEKFQKLWCDMYRAMKYGER